MAFTYPLTLPTTKGARDVKISNTTLGAIQMSQYTGKQVYIGYSGDFLRASVSYPLMQHSDAREFISFLNELRGMEGTFLLGDDSKPAISGWGQYALENMLTRSEQVDNWTHVSVTTVLEDDTGPYTTWQDKGNLIATGKISEPEKIVESLDGGNTFHTLDFNSIAVVSGTQYRASVFLKPAGRTKIQLYWQGTGFPSNSGKFDFENGTVIQSTGLDSATIEDAGNGYYRCTIVGTSNATSSSVQLRLLMANSSGNTSYIGDGSSGMYAWGGQMQKATSSDIYFGTGATAESAPDPKVDGASQSGNALVTDGWNKSVKVLNAGDLFACENRLYFAVGDVTSDANGDATISVSNEIGGMRSSPADNAAIVTANPKGQFRLVTPVQELYRAVEYRLNQISFEAIEAL